MEVGGVYDLRHGALLPPARPAGTVRRPRAYPLPEDTPYEAWAFGGDPDKLAALVLDGVKTATASAYPMYALEKEPLPMGPPEGGDPPVQVVGHRQLLAGSFRVEVHQRKQGLVRL